ncbi:SANT associated [Trema orientale]|uniref:SANT associated n=1 Tax=Trema orientale TaxID=63057 RepID=A0A2P5DS84_TREOI|nr:SANT associated [Trema orientale]
MDDKDTDNNIASSSSSPRLKSSSSNGHGIHITTAGGGPSSCFQSTVCLLDWWLIRTQNEFQGNTLGVEGFTSTEQQAVRLFSSAPIAKRYDVFTLVTCDAVSILLKGLINKRRTALNGFPHKVSQSFLFGFPSNWEQYAQNPIPQHHSVSVSTTVPALETSIPTTSQHQTPNKHVEDSQHQFNVTPTASRRRRSHRLLRNLEDNQNNPPASLCFLDKNNDNYNVSPTSGTGRLLHTLDYDKLNSPVAVTIHSGTGRRKMDASSKSPIHSTPRLPKNSSAKITTKSKQDQVLVCGSKADSRNLKNKAGQQTDAKEESTPRKHTKRKIVFDTEVTPQARYEKAKVSVVSPEFLSYGRSRSGRLLLPVMEFWRNQKPIYDVDRKVVGIQDNIPVMSRGGRSEPQKKQKL